MPYLKLSTNLNISAEQTTQLLPALSQLMAKETGKPERYVMVELTADKAMLFGGSDAPLAYVECKSIGLSATQAKSLSSSIANLLDSHLSITSNRLYIEFSDCPAEFWGWNGATFG
jgi:phenylpyruvate tautomerase PptA (4-oxalocrotonate tautomerase family)